MSISHIGASLWSANPLDLASSQSTQSSDTDQRSESNVVSGLGRQTLGGADAFQQLAAELQSLLLKLQLQPDSASAGSDATSKSIAEAGTTDATTATSAASPLTQIAQDLQSLLYRLDPSADPTQTVSSTSTSTSTPASTAAADGQWQGPPPDDLLMRLRAYADPVATSAGLGKVA